MYSFAFHVFAFLLVFYANTCLYIDRRKRARWREGREEDRPSSGDGGREEREGRMVEVVRRMQERDRGNGDDDEEVERQKRVNKDK